MPLELKDLNSQKPILVPEDGLTFGREGGDANILLRDTGVSKRHARVFGENGAWFLEDLGSSNGTWLQKERIKDATELLPGDIFQLSQAKFEVVQVVGGEGEVEPTSMSGSSSPSGGEDEPVEEHEPTPKPTAAAKPGKMAGAQAKGAERSASNAKPAPAPAAAKKPAGKAGDETRGEASKELKGAKAPPDTGGGGEPKSISVGYFLVTVPKAFAYYLAAIPVLLLNPVGTIRKAVSEQKHEAKGRIELIAWALPAYLITAAFGFLGALIVGIVTGTLSIGSILPIGPLIGAVIGAGISGFFWHPVLNWVVNFLKGESDDRSRTNVFMLSMTATAAMALPGFVTQVLSMVSFPLIGLIPLVLSLAASLLTLFVWFSWFSAAGVVKWFRIVLMVLGGLACLSTLAGLPAAIAGRGTGVSSGSVSTSDVEAQVKAAQAQAEAAQKAADAQMAAAEKNAEAATAAAEKQVAAAEKAAAKAADKAAAAPAPAPTPAAEPAKAAPPAPAAAPAAAPAPTPAAAAAAAPPTPAAAEKKPEGGAPVAAAGNGYASWHTKWDAIEKKLSDDPTLLNKVSGLKGLYGQLEEDIYEIESKYQKASMKKPSERRLNDHLRDAELYEKTEKAVLEIHSKLFP